MKTDENIKIIKTRKYKDINLYLRFSIANRPLLKQEVALLCKMIGDISLKYPTKYEMVKARDMLYGITSETSYKCTNNIITLSLHYIFINPKFLDATMKQYQDFIHETLYNSLINESTLAEAKRNLKAEISRKLENPNYEANEKFIEIVSNDNPDFGIHATSLNFIDDIVKVELQHIKDTYLDIVNNCQLNIYLCGDLTNNDIKVLTKYDFSKRKKVKLINKKYTYQEHKRLIVDKKDISQSCLYVVYSTPFNKKHKDYFAWFLGNALFGVLPISLLFSQVREKQSLCYSISSIDYKNEGLIKVATNIDGKNTQKVIKEINKQLDRMVKADYSVETFNMAKCLLTNSLSGIYDDLDALVNYYYVSVLSDFNYSIEEYIDRINAVSIDDISRVFSKYKHYFNYVLLGENNEKTL